MPEGVTVPKTNIAINGRTLKQPVLERSKVIREILDTLQQYITQEMPRQGLDTQKRPVKIMP